MERAPRPGLGELLGRLFAETRWLVSDYAHLAVLDGRRAALNLAWLLASVLVVAVLVVSAWMGLLAALIMLAASQNMSWIAAVSSAAILNLVFAAGLAWWMRRLVADLPFTALLRQLRGEPAPEKNPQENAHGNRPGHP
jgi:uncharacterized membrane protein YqjE